MNNKENLDIFGQLLNGKQVIIGKPRQVGKTYATQLFRDWKVTFNKHSRAQDRKESIKKLFNI
jgi:hypothetical protein